MRIVDETADEVIKNPKTSRQRIAKRPRTDVRAAAARVNAAKSHAAPSREIDCDERSPSNWFEDSLAIHREHGDQWGVAVSLNNLGLTPQANGDDSAAVALHQERLAMRANSDIGETSRCR